MQQSDALLLANAFAGLCGIPKGTLRFYRDFGLIAPQETGDNGYAKYDPMQMMNIHLIRFMAGYGWSLAEIKDFLEEHSADRYVGALQSILEKQQEQLRRLQTNIAQVRQLLAYAEQYRAGEEQFAVAERTEPQYFIRSPYSYAEDTVELRVAASLREHVRYCEARGCYAYPMGRIVRAEDILAGNAFRVKSICSPATAQELKNYEIPPERVCTVAPGLSLRMWYWGNPLRPAAAYEQLLRHLEGQRYRICGDAWELWVMTRLSSSSMQDYVARIEVPIEQV